MGSISFPAFAISSTGTFIDGGGVVGCASDGPLFYADDNPHVLSMWYDAGIPVFNYAAGVAVQINVSFTTVLLLTNFGGGGGGYIFELTTPGQLSQFSANSLFTVRTMASFSGETPTRLDVDASNKVYVCTSAGHIFAIDE